MAYRAALCPVGVRCLYDSGSCGSRARIVSMRKLSMRFGTAPLFRSIDCIVGGGSHVTLINGGNTNGSAVLGVLTNLRSPARKMITAPGSIAVKCLPRIVVLTSGQAIVKRTRLTFRRVFRLRTELRQVGQRLTRQASCRSRRCRRLVSHFARRGSHFLVVNNAGCRTRVRQALLKLNFDHRSFRHPASRFSNN